MTRTRTALARAALATLLSGAASAAPPVLDPVTQKFIDGLAAAGGPPIYKLSPENAREVLAGGQLAINDDGDTPEIELVELSDSWQAGGEGVLEVWGDLEDKKVSYRASVEVLVPFAQSDAPIRDDKSIVEYTVVEMKAALSFRLVSWATLDYELGALREPLVLDAWQVRNQLLLNFGVVAGNVPPET